MEIFELPGLEYIILNVLDYESCQKVGVKCPTLLKGRKGESVRECFEYQKKSSVDNS